MGAERLLSFRASVRRISRSCGGRWWWELRCQAHKLIYLETTIIEQNVYFHCIFSLSRSHPVIHCFCGSQHFSVHARARCQNVWGDRPSLHPHHCPHGPPRTFHSRCWFIIVLNLLSKVDNEVKLIFKKPFKQCPVLTVDTKNLLLLALPLLILKHFKRQI